jgi:hypothetical protein
MVTINIKTTLDADIQLVWNSVTSLENYSWRSDLSGIRVMAPGKKFIEKTTPDGDVITCTIVAFEPLQRYELEIESDKMKGRFVGLFASAGDKTEIDFTEEVVPKSNPMKPSVETRMKNKQESYLRDLTQYLEIKKKR